MPDPSERWTTVIFHVRQLHAGIERFDHRGVPILIDAAVYVGEDLSSQAKLSRRNTRQIDDRHDATDDRGKLHQAVGGENVRLERLVGGAEIDRVGLDLLYAAARADRLVVEQHAGLRLIGFRPLAIHRGWEGRAGSGNGRRIGAGYGETRRHAGGQAENCLQHRWSPKNERPVPMRFGDGVYLGSLAVL